uniref:Uncharacterized protein n=1 Tax=Arundo donax TaxID=35708 RepID=A0A0A9GZI0_ARUDO
MVSTCCPAPGEDPDGRRLCLEFLSWKLGGGTMRHHKSHCLVWHRFTLRKLRTR